MKLHSFGKILSLAAVLVLLVALACGVAVTVNAEETEPNAIFEADIEITAEALAKGECGKILLTWNKVSGAQKYAVYCNGQHLANSLETFYYVSLTTDAGFSSPEYSFKVVAIDSNEETLAYGIVSAKPEHDYSTKVTDPTCDEMGYTTYTCSDCGDVHKDDYVDKLGHIYGDLIIGEKETCTTSGMRDHYQCSRCELYFMYIPGIYEHDPGRYIEFDPVIPALGHDYGPYRDDNNATCTTDSTSTSVCRNGCGSKLVIVNPDTALGHSFTNYKYDKNATCTEDGTETAECDRECGATHSVVAEGTALGHSFTRYIYDENSATCTEDGTKTAECNNGCGLTETVTAENTALGHSFTNYVPNGDTTCTVDGTQTAQCDNGCGETDTIAHAAFGHSFTNYVPNGDETCTEDGTKTAECDNGCGLTDTVIAEDTALGHSFTNYVPNGDTTCTVDGTQTAQCDNGCGETDTIAHAAFGHSFTNYVSNGDVTCTENGTKTAHCNNGCGETDTLPVDALGHSFTVYTPDGNATCFEDGTKTAKCDHECGLTDTVLDEGSILSHELVLEDNPDAFILYYYCCHCGGEKKFGKIQIPVPYRLPLIKGGVILVCLLVIIFSIRALVAPATTTPWWKRRRY